MRNKTLQLMMILALLGIIVSAYLLNVKYTEGEKICDIDEYWSCSVVDKSAYSEFPIGSGIPVAGIGIAGYILFLLGGALLLRGKGFWIFSKPTISYLIFLLALISIVFSFYLLYIELFVLASVCIFCMASLFLIIAIFVLGILNLKPSHVSSGQ